MDTLSYLQNTKHRAISSSDIRLAKQQKGNGMPSAGNYENWRFFFFGRETRLDLRLCTCTGVDGDFSFLFGVYTMYRHA